jgi:glycosyltransferase involved in cell wall biosynthesis
MAKMKVAVVTCYKDPDYVRARTIRAGLENQSDISLTVLKNRFKGLLRYPEIIFALLRLQKNNKPDVYILTFRGQEILPFLLLIAKKTPIIFDEFIVPLAWATDEKHDPTLKNKLMSSAARSSAIFYRHWLAACRFILTDTTAHAENSARLSGVNSRQYRVLPVGADETLFMPPKSKPASEDKPFQVLYYGSMLPLHGIQHVLDAAVSLKDKDVIFLIIGGGPPTVKLINVAKSQGAKIEYKKWIKFEELPEAIYSADLCLGGPFGGTPQAMQVITGKTYQFLACASPTMIGENEVSQLFVNRDNCLGVAQADPKAIASALVWAMNHRSELKTIGQNGRKLYDSDFSNNVISRELKNLLSELT